jgi:hypothetical protein
MGMRNTIIASLDTLATRLQTAGLIHLAEMLDSVTNTLQPRPEEETEQYREKYSALQDWVRVLHNSVCDSPAVAKLNVYLGTHVVPRATLEAAPEWHAFLGSLHSASLKSKEIPGEAFVKGMNPEGFTWADLAGLPDVLDIKFAAARPGEDKVLDSAAQARREHERAHGPTRSTAWQKADDLFAKREANIILSPKFMRLDRLIRGLRAKSTHAPAPVSRR